MLSDLRVELPDGLTVGYAEAGDPAGPPVMYLHGSPSSRLETGLPGIREATKNLGLRVIAPDRPGIGLSTFRRYSIADYPRLIRSFADALGLGRRQVRLRMRLRAARPSDTGRARVLDLFVRSAGSPGDVERGRPTAVLDRRLGTVAGPSLSRQGRS